MTNESQRRNQQPRSLTDADVEAIVDSLIQKFYGTVGKGFMKIVWVGVMAVLMVLALYGMRGNR